MALEHTKQTAYVGTHAQHDHSTHTHRHTHSYSFYPVYIHGGSTRSPFVSELGTMHQAMAKALVKAQRRATAPQSTGGRREKRPCAGIVPHTAPQSAVPMDNGATGAVGARSMIAALQKAANRNARGGSRKVPASTQAPATAKIQPSVQPMPAQPTPDWMPKGLVVLRVGPQKDQHRSQPRQWRHGVQHQPVSYTHLTLPTKRIV